MVLASLCCRGGGLSRVLFCQFFGLLDEFLALVVRKGGIFELFEGLFQDTFDGFAQVGILEGLLDQVGKITHNEAKVRNSYAS